MPKRIFISADHGMAVIYFLQSDLVPALLAAGVEVVILTDEILAEKLAQRNNQPGLTFASLRLKEAQRYASTHQPRLQWLLSSYLRRVGGSWRINTEAWTATSGKSGLKTAGSSDWGYGYPPRWRF